MCYIIPERVKRDSGNKIWKKWFDALQPCNSFFIDLKLSRPTLNEHFCDIVRSLIDTNVIVLTQNLLSFVLDRNWAAKHRSVTAVRKHGNHTTSRLTAESNGSGAKLLRRRSFLSLSALKIT